MPDPRSSITNRALATEVRRLRDFAGFTGEEVASRLHWSASKVSRLETNRIAIKPRDLRQLLAIYNVGEERHAQLIALASEPEKRGWWHAYSDTTEPEYATYIGLEASAAKIQYWSPELITGLLQTEAYARAILETYYERHLPPPPAEIQRLIDVRLQRQGLLTSADPKRVVFVLDEATLLHRHGSAQVMREQLNHLGEVSRLPNVTIRVLAFAGTHPVVMQGSFALLEFAPVHGMRIADVVYLEELTRNEFVEEEQETHRYKLAFDRLAEAALGPEESRELIARTARERWA